MKGIVLAALLMVAALPARGYDDGGYVSYGTGGKSCGTWQEDRRAGGFKKTILATWVTGYVTGYNAWVEGSNDVGEGTDIDGLLAWIDNYCAENPLNSISKAASALIWHLMTR